MESPLLICEFPHTLPLSTASYSILCSQCTGMTPDGEDFEKFIGPKKAEEFKTLFSSWIHKIYRLSFSLHLLRNIPNVPFSNL